MTEPSTTCPEGTPTVHLNGKDWPIPELAVRQLRQVRVPLLKMNDRLTGIDPNNVLASFNALTEAEFDELVIKPVTVALTRAHPDFDSKEIDDWVVRNEEFVMAWFTVRKQSGVFLVGKAAQGEGGEPAAEGETQAPAGAAAAPQA